MKNSEIIESIIKVVIDNGGAEHISELEWLFNELSTARILEDKESKKS